MKTNDSTNTGVSGRKPRNTNAHRSELPVAHTFYIEVGITEDSDQIGRSLRKRVFKGYDDYRRCEWLVEPLNDSPAGKYWARRIEFIRKDGFCEKGVYASTPDELAEKIIATGEKQFSDLELLMTPKPPSNVIYAADRFLKLGRRVRRARRVS